LILDHISVSRKISAAGPLNLPTPRRILSGLLKKWLGLLTFGGRSPKGSLKISLGNSLALESFSWSLLYYAYLLEAVASRCLLGSAATQIAILVHC